MSDEHALPPGWAWAKVGDLGTVQLGRQRSPANRSRNYPTKYLRAANITWRGLDLSDLLDMEFKPEELHTFRLLPGDVLLSEASGSPNEVGKPALWRSELSDCAFQNTVIRFRSAGPSPAYMRAFFEHCARNGRFAATARGVGIHHLGAERFAAISVPVPPLAEQHRIVEAIEEQFTRLDAAVASLRRTRVNLRRYRAAVLQAAVEGRLVPTEAELAHATRQTFEAGGQLLKRLGLKELSVGAVPTGFPLPGGWAWTNLASIAEFKGGITKGQRRRPSDMVRSVPYLRVANVQRGYLDLREIKTIEATDDEIAELRLLPGDVLFNEGGDRDKLGRGWVWNGEVPECIHQNHVFRARLRSPELQPKFVSWYGNSEGQRYFMAHGKQTTNLASLNLTKLSALPVPVPPLAEQQRIVAEVERRLSIVEELEAVVAANLKRAERLRQAILKRAFEGKLVPQDPSDEPAAVLLERIRAQRQPDTVHSARARGW